MRFGWRVTKRMFRRHLVIHKVAPIPHIGDNPAIVLKALLKAVGCFLIC